MPPTNTEGVPRRVRVHLMSFVRIQVGRGLEKRGAQADYLIVSLERVVRMEIEVNLLLLRSIRPRGLNMSRCTLDANAPETTGVKNAVEVGVVINDVTTEDRGPKGAFFFDLCGIEHDHLTDHLHGRQPTVATPIREVLTSTKSPSITSRPTMSQMSLPSPTLHTERLALRGFQSTDAEALFALHTNARVLRYWDSPPWEDYSRTERFLATCSQIEAEGSGARLAVELLSEGTFIGWCSVTRWNPTYRSASLGYCFDDTRWGNGYATEAVTALLDWAFDTLDLNRVQAETDTRNHASVRVLEKLGFVREGTLREDCVVNGDVSDSHVYGLLRREWRTPERSSRE